MIRYATLASMCLVLFGCGNSVECDSAEVRKVLREIVEENTNYTIMDYKAVTTVSSSSNKCLCRATFKVTDKKYTSGLEFQDMPVEYDVTLADNGKEFAVNLRYR